MRGGLNPWSAQSSSLPPLVPVDFLCCEPTEPGLLLGDDANLNLGRLKVHGNQSTERRDGELEKSRAGQAEQGRTRPRKIW